MTCFSIQFSFRTGLWALACLMAGMLLAQPVLAQAPIVLPTQETAPAAEHAQKDTQKPQMAEDMMEQEQEQERFTKAEAPIFVELFTSKDCTACVYADRILYESLQDKKVIGLSCQIQDLGSIRARGEGSKEASDAPIDMCAFRQWTYRARNQFKDLILKIPTFYFNGTDYTPLDSVESVMNLMKSYHYLGSNKSLEIPMKWKNNTTITLNLPEQRVQGEYDSASVWIIRYKDTSVEKIESGVNKGRVLRFTNIVQYIRHIGKWHGKARTVDVSVPPPPGGDDRGGYVAVIQEMMGEPVLAAGRIEDYPLPGEKPRQRPYVGDQRSITAPLPTEPEKAQPTQ